MKPTKRHARISGFLYLIMILFGMFSLLYVPSKLYVWESAIETQKNIIANEFLFKMGILSDLIMYTTFIFLSLSLYKLLKQINNSIAITMVIFVLISVSISYTNLIPKLNIISLISNTTDVNNINEQSAQLLSFLKSHNNGIQILRVFWGLWLFPFGYLVFKSGFLPKFFGVLLMIGCFGYLTDFFGYFLFLKTYKETIIPTISSIPHALGEIGICLWLLIIGIKKKR